MITHHCVADKDDDDDDRVHLDVVDGYHGDNNSFGGSGDEVSVATMDHVMHTV